ncbi:Phosphorylated carbohydrates phosphatase [bioreactor metagenome]|uniref:Phosphorylated carbohydrates phosphatase n=1 Tax=bioreactor metagenome TaxID=1076179 RepID=A0A644XQI1_9ZZZZ
MNNIKLVIFDVDGLILDTESVWQKAWQIVGEDYGIKNLGTTIFLDLIGINGKDVESILHEKLSYISNPLELLTSVKRKGQELLNTKIDIKPGVFELLDFLDQNNIKKAVATATPRQSTFGRLKKLNLWDRFDFVLCGDEVLKRKPNPEIYLNIVKEMNISKDECLILEDSKVGVKAAFNADIPCIMVPDLLLPTKEEEAKTYSIVNNLYDVKKILGDLLSS